MLQNTFIHIPGIGPKTERMLWRRGILTWQAFLDLGGPIFPPSRDAWVRKELSASIRHSQDPAYFSGRLPASEMWRLFEAFKARSVYLDIETSGGWQGVDEITVIGIYDGREVQTFVNGINLDEFETAIASYDLVVSFNGACFDLPFIRSRFPGISLPRAHIDLRFILKRMGYAGGLKKIEKDLGLERMPGIQGLDGWEAVRLWQAHEQGDPTALKTLIAYNTADIVNLKPLMEMAYEHLRASLMRESRITSIIRGITANLVPGQKNFSSAPGLRAGLLSDLSAGDTCPLRILDFVELRLPPLISHKETAPSRQSRQKNPSASIY